MDEKLITKKVTDLPIGDSGFYFSSNKINGFYVEGISHISHSLYKISTVGMKTVSRGCSETCWDTYTLDLDNKEVFPGYAEKINESLYAIFDIESIDIGWPAHDVIVIKNVTTGKKNVIEFEAAANEEIETDGSLYILSGSIFDGINYEEQKRWKVFMDQDGKIIYKGFCWEHQLFGNKLLIKKFKTSKGFVEKFFK